MPKRKEVEAEAPPAEKAAEKAAEAAAEAPAADKAAPPRTAEAAAAWGRKELAAEAPLRSGSKKEQDGGRFLNVSFLPSSFPSISDLYYPVTGHGSFSGKLVKMEVENRQCEYLEETKECAQ